MSPVNDLQCLLSLTNELLTDEGAVAQALVRDYRRGGVRVHQTMNVTTTRNANAIAGGGAMMGAAGNLEEVFGRLQAAVGQFNAYWLDVLS